MADMRGAVAGFRKRMVRTKIGLMAMELEQYAQALAVLPEVRRGRTPAQVREEFYAGIIETMRL